MASIGFLNPRVYDRDAEDLDSTFDGDEKSLNTRRSTEMTRHSRDVLEEEEETERLIAGDKRRSSSGGMFSRHMFGRHALGPGESLAKSEEWAGHMRDEDNEEGELLWSMERGEGKEKENDSSSMESREVAEVGRSKGSSHAGLKLRRPHILSSSVVYASMIAFILLFLALLFGAYRYKYTSYSTATETVLATLLSNGTSLFGPTTILLSIDGFRASFLSLNLTPTLRSFIDTGISPPYMLPSFPSLTFPNHYTLVTGLHPESHGIVGNTFWDPDLQEEFYYTDPARSMQEKWWNAGEPIWVTAEKQGISSAVHMWPGSEAGLGGKFDAKYVDKYNGTEILGKKVDRILGLLDLPGPHDVGARKDLPRPQLIAAYVPDVDADGHRHGPNSTEITKTISRVDDMLAMLFAGLEQRNLTDVVNVVVVSDHGMATTASSRLIQLDDLIDLDLISHTDGWPLYGVRPKNDEDLQLMYGKLVQKAKENPNFDVYLRDENMPERYHFSRNRRIAPLWIVPKTGWAIVTKSEFDVEAARKKGDIYHPRGLHGYDNKHPLMRAIFVARGPAFLHTPGSRMDVFQNIEVYNIVCDSLGITPHPNNGTLRLPLRPVGLHGDDGAPAEDVPQDPPEEAVNPFIAPVPVFSSLPVAVANVSTSMVTSTIAATEALTVPQMSDTLDGGTAPVPTRPVVSDGGKGKEDAVQDGDKIATWWAWLTGKLQGTKEWVEELLNKEKSTANENSKLN